MIFVPTNYVVVVVGYPRRRRGARLVAGSLQRGGSPFSLLTNSFDRSSSMVHYRAASVQRYSYWQVWISWRLHRRVWNWFLPNMAEVWVSNLLLLILYLSCCEQPADSSKAMLSWLCVPIWTRLWLLTIKYIFRSAFHLSEKDWMHIYEPPATKSSKEKSIEYIRCLDIHLRNVFVYFYFIFEDQILVFKEVFFRKFC